MTITAIVILVFGGVALLVGISLSIWLFRNDESGMGTIAIILALVLGIPMILGPIIYSGTEAGKRALKDQESNFSSGIKRTVRVYDISGNLVESYEGKFDIETDKENYILFDDENGKRHIIYNPTGITIVDEK